ncbi:hypothetical protein [Paraburkholderia caffeinilytica]|uniref:hypothetical protein n=1 Tax=Paraburkholderia caffeinilytica TaxID=1761016 RepID=UPI0013BE9EA2|nr:hypothetical protein [Paraburkholderia caffeinilytica]
MSATALGGQDKALSDYIVGRRGRYCLVEFKAGETAFRSEESKKLRVALCKTMSADRNALRRGKSAHFIAWGTTTHKTLTPGTEPMEVQGISLASYPGTICPLMGFPLPAPENRLYSDQFIEMFLESEQLGANAVRFEKYLTLLFELAGGCASTELKAIEGSIYLYLPPNTSHPPELHSVRFRGLEHLFELTRGRKPNREQSYERDLGDDFQRGGMTR